MKAHLAAGCTNFTNLYKEFFLLFISCLSTNSMNKHRSRPHKEKMIHGCPMNPNHYITCIKNLINLCQFRLRKSTMLLFPSINEESTVSSSWILKPTMAYGKQWTLLSPLKLIVG
nr:hypothetical protein CFP56_55907 [Quercus suber]